MTPTGSKDINATKYKHLFTMRYCPLAEELFMLARVTFITGGC